MPGAEIPSLPSFCSWGFLGQWGLHLRNWGGGPACLPFHFFFLSFLIFLFLFPIPGPQ